MALSAVTCLGINACHLGIDGAVNGGEQCGTAVASCSH